MTGGINLSHFELTRKWCRIRSSAGVILGQVVQKLTTLFLARLQPPTANCWEFKGNNNCQQRGMPHATRFSEHWALRPVPREGLSRSQRVSALRRAVNKSRQGGRLD